MDVHVHKSTTAAIAVAEIKPGLSDLLNAVSLGKTRILIEREGTPVAAIVSVADFERLARFDRARDELWVVVDRMREAFTDVSCEEIEREADRAVAEPRNKIPAPV